MRRWRATSIVTIVVLLRAVSACLGEDPVHSLAPPQDSGVQPGAADAASDTSVESSVSSACLTTAPFGALESLGPAINTTGNEYPGRFSADMRSFVFARQSVGGSGHAEPQLFLARRTSTDGGFDSVDPIFDPPTGLHDIEPSFTPWGAIVFHRGEQGSTQLMIAEPRGAAFADAVPLGAAINAAGTERSPFVSSDGTLYFARAPLGAGPISNGYELFMSPANNDRSFAAPSPVPGLTRPEKSETLPVANGAGTVIYFSSVFHYDAGGLTSTDTTIFRAERASRDVPFGIPQSVPGMNSEGYDSTAWVSDDDCTMVVAHRTADAGNGIDLFTTRRPQR